MVATEKNIINPIQYLQKTSLSGASLMVEFRSERSKYSFYLEGENLLYASNSILIDNILERNLKYLSHRVPKLKQIWNQINSNLNDDEIDANGSHLSREFRKIIWLAQKKHLSSEQISLLGKRISQEVLESLLLIEKISITQVKIKDYKFPAIYKHNLKDLVKDSKKKIIQWQYFMPEIDSPYQRPYLGCLPNNNTHDQLSTSDREKLGRILKGFNFRELAALLNVDELAIAKRLYPLILRKTIILRNPKSQLGYLPKLSEYSFVNRQGQPTGAKTPTPTKPQPQAQPQASRAAPQTKPAVKTEEPKEAILPTSATQQSSKTYNIACIDDSLTVLNSIKQFLNQDNIAVFPINNPAKAMMLMNRIKPDLIFMDIGMPLIDGYQLCSLLRKNSDFKDVPIIMLTGNTGIINRAKAKMSGATDYMTKPFTQDDLLKITFRYLSDL